MLPARFLLRQEAQPARVACMRWIDPLIWLKNKVFSYFQQSFVAGLLVVMPAMLTIWVLAVLVGWIDAIILVVPTRLNIEDWWIFQLPGIGLVIAVFIIYCCGVLVRNYVGRFFVSIWDSAIHRVPIVGSLYTGLSQLFRSMFGDPTQRFGRVVLIPYPREGLWAIAFVTNETTSLRIQGHVDVPCANVFLPTSPNPTSGFYLVVPLKDMVPLDMKVDDAFKLIVSGGIIAP